MKNILACRFVTWKVFFSILQDRTGFTIFLLAITFIFSSFFIVGDFLETSLSYTLTLGGKLGYTELSNLPGGMGGRGLFLLVGGFGKLGYNELVICRMGCGEGSFPSRGGVWETGVQ